MASVWHENGHTVSLQHEELRQVALGMLRARRAMRGTLPAALIHDVALEALLTIYLAHGAAAVEQVIAEAEVPAGTTRRWLAALVAEDVVVIKGERAALTDHGSERMEAMLTSVVRSQRELLGWAQH